MSKTQSAYTWLIVCLYANYFLIGIEQIAVAQHMDAFMARLGTDVSNIALLISGTALGRGIGGCFSGFLADRFGRKTVIVSGTIGLCLSFIGLVTAPTQMLIFIAVFYGGLSTSLIDAGAFATYAEAFPKSSASKAVGSKIAISTGQVVFPLCVTELAAEGISLNISLFAVACLLFLNFIFLSVLKFPKFKPSKGFFSTSDDAISPYKLRRQPSFVAEGIPLLIYAGGAYVAFSLCLIWMPLICQEVAGARLEQSLTTVSFFATGSILSGLITVCLLRKTIRPVLLMAVLPIVTALGAMALWLWPTILMCRIVAFVIGASAAGGVFQIGVSVLVDYFPAIKARMAMAYFLSSAIIGAISTYLLGMLAVSYIEWMMLVNAAVALINATIGTFIVFRFYRIFVIDEKRWGEVVLIKLIG